jgi:alpha-tubulin suppressor-like RCC1 family protein
LAAAAVGSFGLAQSEVGAVPAAAAGLRIAAVAAGMQHSLALSEDGRVFAWGAGHYGALGLGPSKCCLGDQWHSSVLSAQLNVHRPLCCLSVFSPCCFPGHLPHGPKKTGYFARLRINRLQQTCCRYM